MRLNYVTEWCRNPRPGMASFLLQRVTGLGLLAYLLIHLYSIGMGRLGGKPAFDATMKIYDTPLFHVLEWLLLIAVLFHLLNGLRLVAADLLALTRAHRPMFWGVVVAVVVAAAVSVTVFL